MMKLSEVGVAEIVGSAVTVKVTGMLSVVAPGALMVTVPWYVPRARPAGFAVTVTEVGVLWPEAAPSQVPPEVATVMVSGETLLEMATG